MIFGPIDIAAFFFAAAMGVFFGYYRASRLDPIEALRYEPPTIRSAAFAWAGVNLPSSETNQ